MALFPTYEELAAGLKRMDALLICYNIKNDQNHHKVLVKLLPGMSYHIIYMSSYCNSPELIEMDLKQKTITMNCPAFFDIVINNLYI